MDRRSIARGGTVHVCDDAGGVWIVTGWVLGGLAYLGVVLAWHAGYTVAVPFVVIPAVLVFMVGAGNLLSGKRPGRPAPRFNRPDPVPLRPDPVPPTASRRDGGSTVGSDSGGVAVGNEAAEPHVGLGPAGPGR